MSSSVRIFICTPAAGCISGLEHEVFVPLICGAALQQVPAGCLADSSGDSRSLQAWKYGALSAHYWLLKNYLPQAQEDYIGLFTHQRILDFSRQPMAPGEVRWLPQETRLYWRYANELQMQAWTAPHILSCLDGCDALLPLQRGQDNCTMRTIFAFKHNGWELDRTLQIMQQVCPGHLPHAERFLAGGSAYMHGCLIMKRRLLTDYLCWVFELLDALEPGSRWHEYTREPEVCMPFKLMSCMLNVWLAHRAARQPLQLRELPDLLLLHDGHEDALELARQQLEPIFRWGNDSCDRQTYRVFAEVFASMNPDLKTLLCVQRLRRAPEQSELLLSLMRAEPGQPTLRKAGLMLRPRSQDPAARP